MQENLIRSHANVLIPNNHARLSYWTERTKDLPEYEFLWDKEGRGLWVCRAIYVGDR